MIVPSDFVWGKEARVKQNYRNGADVITVSAQYAYEAEGTCDLYAGCLNSSVMSDFENLKEDDAIQSAPASFVYNCISWSGGITNYWEWPLDPYSDYYVPGNDLASFDMFYLYPRYVGCAIYSRMGVNEQNAVIDLWGFNRGSYIEYTHASIRGDSDGHLHGYDWESKPGSLMRTFHPRNAIRGRSYGEIMHSYRRIGTGNAYSLAESIADGNSALENVLFTTPEKDVIAAEIRQLSFSEKNAFNTLYEAWKATWISTPFSNPDKYRNAPYEALLAYCQSVSGSTFLVFEKLGEGDSFATLLVQDLTLTGNATNQGILESVKVNNNSKTLTTSGSMILRTPYSNCMKYVKSLLRTPAFSRAMLSEGGFILTGTEEDIRYSNEDEFTVYTTASELVVEFVLPEVSTVGVEILTVEGTWVNQLLKAQTLSSGSYHYSTHVSPGIYLVKYVRNGTVNIKKVRL